MGKVKTDFQKLFSVEKVGFDNCQAPWDKDRNDKTSRK